MGKFTLIKPVEFRRLVRNGTLKKHHTSGSCMGYKQANMAMVHRDVADDFLQFCKFNHGPFPLLYHSKPGETNSSIAEDSDVRTDLPGYKVYKNGEFLKTEDSLIEYEWKDMVSFYIGCSFSFEENLIKNNIKVRNVEQGTKNVSMYKTNIPCYPVGPFRCNMVVSMRPIPENQLSLVTDVTSQMPDVHGAPVHIGNPEIIVEKSKSLSEPDFGDQVKLMEGDVPVFWACGFTNSEAIKSAKQPLAMTHAAGMMFVTDVPQESYTDAREDSEKCAVIKFSDKGHRYSALSLYTQQILNQIDDALSQDPGNRGISHLHIEGDFAKSALAISHATSVAITTGFPVHVGHNPPDETDGLPGVFSIAAMMQALGKKVTLIVDTKGFEMNQRIMKTQVQAGILKEEISVVPYYDESGKPLELIDVDGNPKYEVVIATERCGRAFDGRYYTMKARDISDMLDPIDDLFEEATRRNDVVTICVGDGGNELGMGKVANQTRKHITNGEKIAAKVSADHVLAAAIHDPSIKRFPGVSNWGCYGLACALYALRKCPIHDRYYRRATGPETDAATEFGWALPSVEREEKNLKIIESEGIQDGCRPDQKMSVDGFKFHPTHKDMISMIRKIIGE